MNEIKHDAAAIRKPRWRAGWVTPLVVLLVIFGGYWWYIRAHALEWWTSPPAGKQLVRARMLVPRGWNWQEGTAGLTLSGHWNFSLVPPPDTSPRWLRRLLRVPDEHTQIMIGDTTGNETLLSNFGTYDGVERQVTFPWLSKLDAHYRALRTNGVSVAAVWIGPSDGTARSTLLNSLQIEALHGPAH